MTAASTDQLAPFTVQADETNDDTATSVDGNVTVSVTVELVGTVAQVGTDWASILAVVYASPSAVVSWA